MRSLFKAAIITLPLFLADISSHADTAPIPTTAKPSVTTSLRPVNGMTMQQVEIQFGPPVNKLPVTGNPPISRWTYHDYTVYFERQHVIHAVIHH